VRHQSSSFPPPRDIKKIFKKKTQEMMMMMIQSPHSPHFNAKQSNRIDNVVAVRFPKKKHGLSIINIIMEPTFIMVPSTHLPKFVAGENKNRSKPSSISEKHILPTNNLQAIIVAGQEESGTRR
jgi:hypothetical protein